MQGLGLPTAETACERCRLASRDGVIHEMMVVTNPVVARALEPSDLSYHSRPEIGFTSKEINGHENLLHEFHIFLNFPSRPRKSSHFFKKSAVERQFVR